MMWLKDITGTWLPASPVSLSASENGLRCHSGLRGSGQTPLYPPDPCLGACVAPWERQTDNADTPVGASSVSSLHIFIHSLSGG